MVARERLEAESKLFVGLFGGFGVLMCLAASSFLPIYHAEWYRYFAAIVLTLVNGWSAWAAWRTGYGANLLRFPAAVWVMSLLAVASVRKFEVSDLPVVMLFLAPFLTIAMYSGIQYRQPDGGKQLEIPVGMVHSYKRLGWKWMTRPQLDFWLVWVGILTSPALGIYCFARLWDRTLGNAWAYLLAFFEVVYLAIFAYQWFKALGSRGNYKNVVVSAGLVRGTGLLFAYCFRPDMASWTARLSGFLVVFGITSLIENAYGRCCERQTQEGILEYESLEGPSVGL
ncbi:MAG: hypothetical protein JST51_17890 [Armatimonadetes bacterium]|nr:hypothetical protein [Armatimonadota bacterium]